MIAKIFVSLNLFNRQTAILTELKKLALTKLDPDVCYFEDGQKLGIKESHKIRSFLSIKPLSSNKLVLVESAQNFTHDAQNALLKTLEEPPPYATIVLGTSSVQDLLPTIFSRCEVYYLDLNNVESLTPKKIEDFEHFFTLTLDEQFSNIEICQEREAFLSDFIQYLHTQIRTGKIDIKTTFLLKDALKWQKANGNNRAILEYLILTLTEQYLP